MKHNGFDLKERYYKDGFKSTKQDQIDMIKRHYIDYVEGDWVLWVIPDLYHAVAIDALVASIQIKKSDGTVLDVPYVARKPYPNKRIHQLSMKSGRKRLYGIPLVFKTYRELCDISDIVIKWEIYENWSLGGTDEPLDVHVKQVMIDYHLNFDQNSEHPEYRFYTVGSKDALHEPHNYKENADYYSEFDVALAANGAVQCGSVDWDLDIDTVAVLNRVIDSRLKRKDLEALDVLSVLDLTKKTATTLLDAAQVKNEMPWNGVYYKKTETLMAQYMADLLPEPSFGFGK